MQNLVSFKRLQLMNVVQSRRFPTPDLERNRDKKEKERKR